MKKIKNILLFSSFLYLLGCSTENEAQVEVAVVDAAAQAEMAVLLFETVPACWAPPFGTAACVAVSAAAGLEASGVFGRQNEETYTFGKVSNINLPEQLKLSNNVYEIYGTAHNLGLNYINSKSNLTEHQSKIKGYDKNEWTLTLKAALPDKTNDEILDIYNFVKDRNTLSTFNYSKYEDVESFEDVNQIIEHSLFSHK